MSNYSHILVIVSYEHIKNNYLHLINLSLLKFILELTLIFLLMSPWSGDIKFWSGIYGWQQIIEMNYI